ncbi:MAG: hypothetical protein ABIO24_12890 [Saprospiraceae bacterium]
MLSLLPSSWAQESSPPVKLGFANEIGIDFATLVRGRKGAILLYKHAICMPEMAKWKKRTALRGLGGYYQEAQSSFDYIPRSGDTIFNLYSQGSSQRYFAFLGIERQLTKGKFRVYFGGDAGCRHSIYRGDGRKEVWTPGVFIYENTYQSEVRSNSIEASIFGGCNFFLYSRLSLGLELLHFSYAVELSSGSLFRDGVPFFSNRNTITVQNLDIPRLIYLSFHF